MIELLKQALEALEGFYDYGYDRLECHEHITAIKQAIAELESQEPVAHWSDCAVHSEPAYPKGECDCGGYTPSPQRTEQDSTYVYASSLATAIWRRHYMKDSPKWNPLDTTEGVLTQIDNMTCSLVKEKPAQPEQSTGNILMDSYKAMQSMKVEGPLHVVCQCDKCKTESQEPVAWAVYCDGFIALPSFDSELEARQEMQRRNRKFPHNKRKVKALYDTPPQRTWVGLTDEETERLIHNFGSDPHTLLDEADARLKARNT